ncbi:MAG: DUF1828 domain-containing protein [Phascolarctobacterium sp.]|uniref:DUF1828 domain-containing protein n=1 Tax=Phascolarctobacterium sp. TaxID=2049039 RepID=UPI0026DC046E|nr:DUF1828 domain-containing protein [Phascolarctobacterium sp.]MDO4920600.1 DUF1828 domain-containing protein [Phascolarctobacterium sp.]
MDKTGLINILKTNLNNSFTITERKEGLYQIFAPFYHSDGDMIDIFVKVNPESPLLTVCDCGITLMRLSYDYDIDTERKKNILKSILKENNVSSYDENLSISTKPEFLFQTILSMTQTINKISAMSFYQRDVITSLFFEQVNDFVITNLHRFDPKKDFAPIPGRDELTVDYCFPNMNKPIYLFTVKGSDRAKTAVISMLSFQNADIPFTGAVVYDNFGNLGKKDQKLLMSAADKQFYDLSDFKKNMAAFIGRVAM